MSSELPKYGETLRGFLTANAHRALWLGCHATQPIETFITDCKPDLSEREVRAMLETFQTWAELTEQLSYWIGQNIFELPTQSHQIQHGEKVIAAIDRKLGLSIYQALWRHSRDKAHTGYF